MKSTSGGGASAAGGGGGMRLAFSRRAWRLPMVPPGTAVPGPSICHTVLPAALVTMMVS